MSDSEFWSHWAWPLATGCLGLTFTVLVGWQWWRRRRPHQAAWTAGMFLYTAAAIMEAWSEYSDSWNPTVYRMYIVLAASLVGFLGLGTLYLAARRRIWGHAYLVFILLCMAAFFVGVFTVTLDSSKLVPGITVGGQGLGPSLSFPRVMSLPLNITGSLFLFGGALYSIWRFLRRREFAYRVWANVLIALGAGLLAFVGSRARIGSTAGLYPAEMAGAALMLAGFLLAGTLEKGRRVARARRKDSVGG
ncbi:MAG: hypothetical protein M1274_08665 [Actinobacteria bacterium]|nr:hypothetical protein [Actinomycetota bacterium]